MLEPLRPELYQRLKDKFIHIVIANERQAMKYRYEDGRLKVSQAGEYYRVNCPYCHDTRKRLWINHRWGLYDEITKSHNLWLAHCYNEDCLKKEPERRKALFGDVFDPTMSFTSVDIVEVGTFDDLPSREPFVPGRLVPICNLPQGHPAATYLLSRGFDLNYLAETFHISYCCDTEENMSLANNRIFIPVHHQGKFVGWQARTVGEPSSKYVPKYYSMPGWRKGQFLYNFDQAIKFNYVIVCEGPTDVWRLGADTVCTFGKLPTPQQGTLLCDNWRVYFLMLDSDVSEDEVNRARQRLDPYNCAKCITVPLPPGKDPGSMDPEYLDLHIETIAAKEGVELTMR